MERISFYDEIARNKRSSYFLIFFILLILLGITYTITLVMNPAYTTFILIIGTIISILYVVVGYYKSADIAVASSGSVPAPQAKYPLYHNLVEGLCLASGLPKPKLYVMNHPQINAFASGRDPNNAVISVTTGALEKLNKQELEGVLAHELSHIAHYDIRFMTLAAVLIGMISIISQMFLRSLWMGGMDGNRENNKGNAIFLVIGIILAILAPILTMLVQLAISRKREYAADSSAVKFIRSPTGLIGALKKIGGEHSPAMKVSGAVSPLFISNPSRTAELFMTHPPLPKRIAKLEKM